MVMQSVLPQISEITSRNSTSVNTTKKAKGSEFEIFFGKSIKQETKNPVRSKAITIENTHKSSKIGNDKEDTLMPKADNTQDLVNDNTVMVKNVTDKSQDKVDEALDTQDHILASQLLAAFDQIREAIMEELDLAPEELDQMMEEMGIVLSDLRQPQAIMQLVLANSSATDSTAILLDEQLENTFKGLLRSVETIDKDLLSKLTEEEIKLILEQADVDEALSNFQDNELIQPFTVSNKDSEESVKAKESTMKFQVIDNDTKEEGSLVAVKDDNPTEAKEGKEEFNQPEAFDTFLDKLSANYDTNFVESTGDTLRTHEIREIAQQIIDQIRVTVKPGQTTMELQLNPEHLGKVNLTVSSKEGVMTAHFVVQNEITKEAVESQMITLKDTLAEQGIKVDTIDVTVASYTFDQNNQSNEANQMMQNKSNNRNKITFEEAIGISEDNVEDENAIKLAGSTGYAIDYTA